MKTYAPPGRRQNHRLEWLPKLMKVFRLGESSNFVYSRITSTRWYLFILNCVIVFRHHANCLVLHTPQHHQLLTLFIPVRVDETMRSVIFGESGKEEVSSFNFNLHPKARECVSYSKYKLFHAIGDPQQGCDNLPSTTGQRTSLYFRR